MYMIRNLIWCICVQHISMLYKYMYMYNTCTCTW